LTTTFFTANLILLNKAGSLPTSTSFVRKQLDRQTFGRHNIVEQIDGRQNERDPSFFFRPNVCRPNGFSLKDVEPSRPLEGPYSQVLDKSKETNTLAYSAVRIVGTDNEIFITWMSGGKAPGHTL
jgi:hypothetical protein